MISLEDRQSLSREIEIAHQAGARLRRACKVVGIDVRTLQRWKAGDGLDAGDGRPRAVRPVPAKALSAQERREILDIANDPRFAALPPARIVPMLADDEGIYVASESTFHRVLRAQGQNAHRGRAKAPRKVRPPTTHVASAPGQVWCWDMTYLPATVIGRWFHLYLILDLYSRKIIGWEVHDTDDAGHAAHLVRRTALAEGIALGNKPVLHGDNGSTLKATTVIAMLQYLGITASYSRPRVSDDNAYAEALFRTAKYRPEFPAQGFTSLEQARQWASDFVHWYNVDHRHSGIQYVSPQARHRGRDRTILAARHDLYLQAQRRHPLRWSGKTRDWSHIDAVTLNPERDCIVSLDSHTQSLAA